MDFRLTADQEALRRGMRELLAARFGREALRAAVDGDEQQQVVDGRLWRELGEAGLFALRAPQSAGGVGLGLPEAVLLFEEAGRALLPGPLVASHLAGGTGLVAGAADGSVVVTALEEGPRPDCGAAPLVEHLDAAGAVLALGEGYGAGAGEGCPVRVLAPGQLVAEPMRSVDPLSPLHRVHGLLPEQSPDDGSGRFADEQPGSGNGDGGTGGGGATDGGATGGRGATDGGGASDGGGGRLGGVSAEVLRGEAALLTAALQLGSACRTLELAVGYAREREQFGRPIGAFQAVQHLCAEMLVRSETARSVVYAAAVTADDEEISAAKLLADTAAVGNARDCLQVHGGMGFTWEADVHLHLKRAWLRAEQWRTAVAGEERLASALLRPICR
ncbi:acyl-CoA dehydrogenase [Streptomyces sp. RK75]|nr:acyl-CoA dehydrogenase [Streptomyces sp. RK75]MBQ0867745.1 acyl-CoA dehydrogenase family protein [Streptomyces sp. RK75]